MGEEHMEWHSQGVLAKDLGVSGRTIRNMVQDGRVIRKDRPGQHPLFRKAGIPEIRKTVRAELPENRHAISGNPEANFRKMSAVHPVTDGDLPLFRKMVSGPSGNPEIRKVVSGNSTAFRRPVSGKQQRPVSGNHPVAARVTQAQLEELAQLTRDVAQDRAAVSSVVNFVRNYGEAALTAAVGVAGLYWAWKQAGRSKPQPKKRRWRRPSLRSVATALNPLRSRSRPEPPVRPEPRTVERIVVVEQGYPAPPAPVEEEAPFLH